VWTEDAKQREHSAAEEAEHKAELEAVLLEMEPDIGR